SSTSATMWSSLRNSFNTAALPTELRADVYFKRPGLFNDGPPSAAIENWAAALPTELRADI
ncbi:hypothetical protein ACFLY0_00180, partial [Patescibacteria group bacterium]